MSSSQRRGLDPSVLSSASREASPGSQASHEEDERVRPSSDASGEQPIVNHMLGDQPAKTKEEDRLGFQTYVSAVAKFLTDSSTEIPLTLSIEGLWGAGKSSFMLQLQQELRTSGKARIVAFNAWQYNADDGLWAAFIHEFDEELNRQLSWPQRMLARWKLLRLRTKWEGWTDTIVAFVWLVASLVAFVAIADYLSHGGLAAFTRLLGANGQADTSANKTIALVGGLGGALASLLILLYQIRSLFKSPASFERAVRLFSRPNYDDRLPLIHKVTRDFNSLVASYAGQDDVYVFIDDLDRCEYAKAAELMQALLMLLSSAPKIALIIGLDRDKVAAAMAAKQEKLIPYLYRIEPSDAYRWGIDYGQRFIEKFIQISFFLPAPRSSGLKAMVNPKTSTPDDPVPQSQKSEQVINIVTGKDDSKTLDAMIDMADHVFGHNPRNVKQFVNMFRLQAFIANETGLFGTSHSVTKTGRPLTIPQLGKFVILCMRWPDFVHDAVGDTDLIAGLDSPKVSHSPLAPSSADSSDSAPTLERNSPTGRLAFWRKDLALVNLLRFGISEGTEADPFSLVDVDFARLNEIAPSRPKTTTDIPGDLEAERARRVESRVEVKEERPFSA